VLLRNIAYAYAVPLSRAIEKKKGQRNPIEAHIFHLFIIFPSHAPSPLALTTFGPSLCNSHCSQTSTLSRCST